MPLDARDCDYCRESFVPKRVDQRFCVGKDCRKRYHEEYNLTHVHTCWHCGVNHDPEQPAFMDVLELVLKQDLPPADIVQQLRQLVVNRRGSVGVPADDAHVA